MAEPRVTPVANQTNSQTGSHLNPFTTSHLRHRPLSRSAATVGDLSFSPARVRRGSTLSDTVSEARQSIKSSTNDLFLPRVSGRTTTELHYDESSHWQSVPLALALLPAVGGVFFKNGSSVLTDITLLMLAAVFLNWSVRLPW